uniref:Arginase n=1 Tax=Candidatus Kentrum sp. FM TaxID=2126340 RepID=A0A450WX66_9GAMM|nr:MAG: arginase [Candidatus Kentron sp. FM]VFJ73965.1 MAG: arginase [Candidatus Kentron sp. FM]VFK21627.1 MAG: arginase [Candidatus Kentron sp. FM]
MKKITIIGVEMDLGQSRRGVDMGPNALRYAELDSRLRRLGYPLEDHGNIKVPNREMLTTPHATNTPSGKSSQLADPREDSHRAALAGEASTGGKLDFLPSVAGVCREIYRIGRSVIAAGQLPIFLGGDHSIAVGSIGGVTHCEPVGVLWIDAHGDFNTPATSPSGNLHGMPLATLLGHGAPEWVDVGRAGPKLAADRVVLIGIRDLDGQERQLLVKSGVTFYTMRDIDELGIATVANKALERLSHLSHLHVSLDMDVLDPAEAPGVGTPVYGGLTYREAHLLMEVIADRAHVCSIDVVEINPILDHRNHTSELAVNLVASLLGQAREATF